MKTVARSVWDLLLVISLICLFGVASYSFNFYDALSRWLHHHDSWWKLDELFVISWIAALLLAWYAWRRQQEAVQENQRRKQSEAALQVEVAERQRAQEQLAHAALHDALTGLPNRVLFVDRLRHAIEIAQRQEGYRFATLFLDLDHFKVVNDSLGHAIGDQLLIGIAQRLCLCLRTGDTVARLSGDEFVMLLEDTKDEQEATTTAQRIQAQLKQPFSLSGHQLFASASVGIVAGDQGYDQPEDVLRDADIAMYQAKAHGKAGHAVFNLTMRERAQTRLELEYDLRYTLDRHELALHYQPLVARPDGNGRVKKNDGFSLLTNGAT